MKEPVDIIDIRLLFAILDVDSRQNEGRMCQQAQGPVSRRGCGSRSKQILISPYCCWELIDEASAGKRSSAKSCPEKANVVVEGS